MSNAIQSVQQTPVIATSSASLQTNTMSSGQPVNQPIELSHQTFQAWIDLLVDPNSTEDLKLKTVTDLSLSLDVYKMNFYLFINNNS